MTNIILRARPYTARGLGVTGRGDASFSARPDDRVWAIALRVPRGAA